MGKLLPLVFTFSCFHSQAQELGLFGSPENLSLVEQGGYFIYNNEYERADSTIAEVEKILPDHPIVYMMKALNIAWKDMPIRTTSRYFPAHYKALQKVIETSVALQDKDKYHQEGIFFEMSARGLLAEYYAREGGYLKAIAEARKMYTLAKKGFDFVDSNTEFSFSTGLYNYFREMYPERHPIYKPFMWFFRSGDVELGLKQMDKASREGKVVKIEASLYLAYIYLRYEDKPATALQYLSRLVEEYPNNSYFKAKKLECLVVLRKYKESMPIVEQLKASPDPYYRMCGEVFHGVYHEKHMDDRKTAKGYYQRGLKSGEELDNKGLFYKSMAYLGLGRISVSYGDKEEAKEYFKLVLKLDENEALNKEAKQRLKNLR